MARRGDHWRMSRGAGALAAGAAALLTACGPSTPPTERAVTPAPSPSPSPVDLRRHDWDRQHYPLTCDGFPTTLVRAAYADLTGDGAVDAVVAARCDTGAGSPPSEVYAYVATPGGPRFAGRLVGSAQDWLVDRIALTRTSATIQAHAYSGSTPRCCPDLLVRASYRWDGSHFTAGGRTLRRVPAGD